VQYLQAGRRSAPSPLSGETGEPTPGTRVRHRQPTRAAPKHVAIRLGPQTIAHAAKLARPPCTQSVKWAHAARTWRRHAEGRTAVHARGCVVRARTGFNAARRGRLVVQLQTGVGAARHCRECGMRQLLRCRERLHDDVCDCDLRVYAPLAYVASRAAGAQNPRLMSGEVWDTRAAHRGPPNALKRADSRVFKVGP